MNRQGQGRMGTGEGWWTIHERDIERERRERGVGGEANGKETDRDRDATKERQRQRREIETESEEAGGRQRLGGWEELEARAAIGVCFQSSETCQGNPAGIYNLMTNYPCYFFFKMLLKKKTLTNSPGKFEVSYPPPAPKFYDYGAHNNSCVYTFLHFIHSCTHSLVYSTSPYLLPTCRAVC